MIQKSTTGTDEQTSSAQNSKQDPTASKGMTREDRPQAAPMSRGASTPNNGCGH